MSDFWQNRPVPGASISPVVVATAPSTPTTIHVLANLPEARGGPPLDQIVLWAYNEGASSQTLRVTVQGVSIDVSIQSGAIVKIFDGAVFKYDGGGSPSGSILAQNLTGNGDILVWGKFSRA